MVFFLLLPFRFIFRLSERIESISVILIVIFPKKSCVWVCGVCFFNIFFSPFLYIFHIRCLFFPNPESWTLEMNQIDSSIYDSYDMCVFVPISIITENEKWFSKYHREMVIFWTWTAHDMNIRNDWICLCYYLMKTKNTLYWFQLIHASVYVCMVKVSKMAIE